jgi:hypothetical protein
MGDPRVSCRTKEQKSRVRSDWPLVYGSRRLFTTPFHPQTDGAVERFNQTLLSTLSILVDGERRSWVPKVEDVCQSYNAAVHSATGYPPMFLFHGAWPLQGIIGIAKPEGDQAEAARKAREKVAALFALISRLFHGAMRMRFASRSATRSG